MRAAAVLAITLTLACGPRVVRQNDTAAAASAFPRYDAKSAEFEVPPDRAAAAAALVERLRDALVREDLALAETLVSGGDLLAGVGREIVEILEARDTKFRLEPLCPAGSGLYVRLAVIRGLFVDPRNSVTLYAGPDASGEWRLFPVGARNAVRARMTAHVARVRVDPAARRLSGDAILTIETGGERWVPVELDLADPEDPASPGFTPRSVGIAGTGAVPFHPLQRANALVVDLGASPPPRVALAIGWDGAPTPVLNALVPDEALLHEAQPWMPILTTARARAIPDGAPAPRTDADFDLAMEEPKDFELLLEGDPQPRPLADGWKERRTRFHSDRGATVFGAPRYEKKTLALEGVRVVIAVRPELASRLPVLAADIAATHAGLKILGPLPSAHLRIVECRQMPGVVAVGGRSFLGLGHRKGLERNTVAHELAHNWFGGIIPSTFRGEWGGQWPEPVAEYVVQWTLSEDHALAQREEWAACYARPMGDEGAIRAARNVPGSPGQALLYCKGPLVLAALETRIGRPKMQEALGAFVRERAGRPSNWEHLAAAIGAAAGAEHEAWLRRRLARVVSSSWTIEGLAVKNGVAAGTLLQRVEWNTEDLAEDVELGFLTATGEPAGAPSVVQVTGRTTSFAIPVPPGATRLVIDPRVVLPRKYVKSEPLSLPN